MVTIVKYGIYNKTIKFTAYYSKYIFKYRDENLPNTFCTKAFIIFIKVLFMNNIQNLLSELTTLDL